MSAEAEIQAAREALREWRALVETPAWKRLVSLAEEQKRLRTDSIVLSPLADASGVYEQEFKKGEVSGIALFVQIPQISIELCQADIERAAAELGKESQNAV